MTHGGASLDDIDAYFEEVEQQKLDAAAWPDETRKKAQQLKLKGLNDDQAHRYFMRKAAIVGLLNYKSWKMLTSEGCK